MTTVEAALQRPAEALEAFKAAQIDRTRGALDAVRIRARQARLRAKGRALAQFDRGRSVAATRLEGLADALRPMDPRHRARRKAAMIAGGSGVALLAAIGLGVALGMTLSKRLKRKEQVRERLAASSTPPQPPQDADEVLTTPAAF